MNRRTFLRAGAAALSAGWVARSQGPGQAGPRPRPSPAQLAWQREELAVFIHFGVNTFTNREWGDGREDPAIFAPTRLDPRQWARAARAGGFRAVVLTAKHHDGFCLWPSRTTSHTVARSPWRGGAGDVVREFVDACRAEQLRPGLYLSPWDRNNPTYGDSPRYNDLYCEQLTELLTGYGPLAEVWFDGANGEGPNGRKQEYDWPRVWALVRKLQPEAVMFSDAGPDVRWCGNEHGTGGEPNWSTVDPSAVPYPGIPGRRTIAALQHGDPHGTVWRPAEADTSIRPGWFYHPAEDTRGMSAAALVDLYDRSVGRNAKLLLNVPPTPAGLLHETDVARLAGFRARLKTVFANDLTDGQPIAWWRTGDRTARADVVLRRPGNPTRIRLEEAIERGQRVAAHSVYASEDDRTWRVCAAASTIGYARIHTLPALERVHRLRVMIEDAVAPPDPIRIKVFDGPL
jgi:alpha-L-fucosidase